MAQATEQQVKDLETALMQQFYNLVQAANFRINLARIGDPKKPLSENKAFVDYSKTFSKLVDKWIEREAKYETQLLKKGIKGIIASGDIKRNDFAYSESLPKLQMLVKKYDADKSVHGMGFIPLLIWAAIAIAGFFTAKEIVDDLTTTTQEKEELMTKTAQTCKDLNLTPDQCNAMISQTQAEVSSGSSLLDSVKYVALGLLALFIVPKIIPSSK